MIHTRTYYGEPGLWYLIDAALTNVQILMVSREDKVHYLTGEEDVESLEYAYSPGVGSIKFDTDNPFTGPPGVFVRASDLEKIKVKYKI